MKKVFVIGTVHSMMPKYKKELASILEEITPDQILVEIVDKDLKNKNTKKYPEEMVFAYKWGIKHKKRVDGFDAPISMIKKSVPKKRLKEMDKEVFKIIDRHNWKEWNKKKYDKDKEFEKFMDEVLDKDKHKLRQRKMLDKIRKMMIKEGKILILTGSYHLRFVEKNLKGAVFPLRK